MTIEQILDKVTNDFIINFMNEYGSPVIKTSIESRTGQELLWFKTICHGGHSSKLCYFTQSKNFYCYTNCGYISLLNLMEQLNGKSFKDNLYLLQQSLGIHNVSNRKGFEDKDSFIHFRKELEFNEDWCELKQENKERIQLEIYDKNILNCCDNHTFYEGWINDGITIASMQKYNINYYWLENHIIIPHYNINGELVGIRRRSLNPEDSKNKYMPAIIEGKMFAHPLGLNWYGLYQNKEAIIKQKEAIIVEGEKSVLLGDGYYGNNNTIIASCGFNVSDWQIEELASLGVQRVYLAFDKDFDILEEENYKKDSNIWNEYSKYREKINKISKNLATYFNTYVIFDKSNKLLLKDSPVDRGKETFEYLKHKATPVRNIE